MPNDYGHEYADKELKSLEKRITKEYKQAAKEVEKKMNDYLAKFADKDAQMKKRLEAGEISSQEYAEWRMRQMFTGDRWKAMSETLSADLVNVDKIAAGMINDSLPSSYAENFNYGTYEVEHGAKMNTNFVLYDKDTVINLMKDDPKIIPKANVDIPKDMVWNKRKIISAVTQGILQGEAIPKIAKRLQSVTDMDRRAAIRNARTYTTAAENKGRIDSYDRAKDMGINVKKEWIATLDERTRMEHRHLDGMAVDNDEPFETDGYKIMYPGDPDAEPEMIYSCRCTLVARIADYKYNDERNDSKLGDMTYEEWKHAKDKITKQENVPETQKSFVESLIGKQYSPHWREFNEYADYRDARKEYNGEETKYVEDLSSKDFKVETSWMGGKYYDDKIPRIEATIVELNEKYPIESNGDFVYGQKLKKITVCDYDFVWEHLPDGQDDRRLTDNATAQVFLVSNTKDNELKEHEGRAVIGFRRGQLVESVEDVIKERDQRIKNGIPLLDIGGGCPETVACHEYGHIISNHIDNAFTNQDETATEYWEWYKSLTKEEIRNGLSDYATTNRGEFEAECFAELQMPNTRPIALKFKEYMDEIIKKGY